MFAPTEEERDLWVNGIYRLLNIPVEDAAFTPMKPQSKQAHTVRQEIVLTDEPSPEYTA